MRVYAIQTGQVRIKASQVVGRGHGLKRRLAPLIDSEWSAWLPVFAYAIEHRDGVVLVNSGASAAAKSLPRWHPYFRNAVRFDIEPDEEAGAQLRAIGIGPSDVRRVVLTHLHIDHDGGTRERFRQAKFWSVRANLRGPPGSPAGFAAICRNAGPSISIRNLWFSTEGLTGCFRARSVSPPTAQSSPWRRPATRPTISRSSSRMEIRPSSSPATPPTARRQCFKARSTASARTNGKRPRRSPPSRRSSQGRRRSICRPTTPRPRAGSPNAKC